MKECEIIREWILLDLDGMCTPEEQARIRAHLAHCPECSSYEREMRQLTAGVAQWGEEVPPLPEDFTAQVMARIQAQPTAPAQAGKQPKKVIRLGRWLAMGASAAALALVFLTTNGKILPAQENNTLTAPQTSISYEDKDAASADMQDAAAAGDGVVSQTTPQEDTTQTTPQTEVQGDKANPEGNTTAGTQPSAPSTASTAPAGSGTPSTFVTPKNQRSDDGSVSSAASAPEEDAPLQEGATDAGSEQSPFVSDETQPDVRENSLTSAATLDTQTQTTNVSNITGWVQLTPTEQNEDELKQQLSAFPSQEDGYLIASQQWPEVRQWCEQHQVAVQLDGTEEGDILAVIVEASEVILPDPAFSTQTSEN